MRNTAHNHSNRFCFVLIATAAAIATPAHASTLTLGAAAGYNAFVLGNFTESGTDSLGAIAVGGNFAPANNGGFNVATNHSGDGAGIYDLVVGGSFTDANNSLGGGSAFIGGNMTWTNPTLPNNVYVNGNFSNPSGGGSVGGTIYYGGTFSSGDPLANSQLASPAADPIDFVSAQTNLNSLSSTLASQTANGTVSDYYNTYTLTGTNASINVFNLTSSSYSSATFNITAPSGSTVIINVAGAADSFSSSSINLSGVSANDVIWNFSSATTLSVGTMAFYGAILAPEATFTGNSGQINGQLIVDNAAGNTELHDVLFEGALPAAATSATPEPGTWVLLLSGAVLIAVARRGQQGEKRN